MNEILHQQIHSRATMPPVNVLGVSVDRLTPDTLIKQVLALKPRGQDRDGDVRKYPRSQHQPEGLWSPANPQ